MEYSEEGTIRKAQKEERGPKGTYEISAAFERSVSTIY